MTEMADSIKGYCHQCDADREILLTVPWQDNSCTQCGSADVTVHQEA